MKKTDKIKIVLSLLLLASSVPLFSQDEETTDQTLRSHSRKSKFLTGLYVSSYFANKYSASTYSGYGIDVNGNRNTFSNSLMNQKINVEYGGGWGHDYIADALGVDQGQWKFTEDDMPFNMHYTPAIMVGANFKIPLTDRSAFIINVNGSKLNLEGNFTITTDKPNSTNPALNTNVQTFAIRGREQRLVFQAGFQQLFGSDDKFNFLLEGGVVGTLVKYDKNIIYINNLTIDLNNYVNQTSYASVYPTRRPVGFGVGAFAGMGINLDVSPKFIVQLLYTPSYEKVDLGTGTARKFQHAIGLRAYYKLGNKGQVQAGD